MRTFEELVDEAAAADVTGWGFDWFDGRATEERPPWGYARLLAERLSTVGSALDIDTGGGEVLAGVRRFPEREAAAAEVAGLTVVDLRVARCQMEFFDIGAVVYILRKWVWWVPDFTIDRYADRLATLDEQIRADGPFVAHSTRHLIEARREA